MPLKHLGQFNRFALNGFTAEKTLILTGIGPAKDYNTGELIGTRVELTIIRDDTQYKVKDGEQVTNLYNKLIVKVPGKVDIKIGTEVEIVNGVATIYGQYRNELSIKADDVRPVATGSGGKA